MATEHTHYAVHVQVVKRCTVPAVVTTAQTHMVTAFCGCTVLECMTVFTRGVGWMETCYKNLRKKKKMLEKNSAMSRP